MPNRDLRRHQWLIEFSKAPADLQRFADLLDRKLQEVNSDYEAKRYKDITLQHLELIEARAHKVPRLSNSREHIEQLLALQGRK